MLNSFDNLVLCHSHTGYDLLNAQIKRHNLQTSKSAHLTFKSKMKFFLILLNLNFVIIRTHHLCKRRANESGRNGENSYSKDTDCTCDQPSYE